MKIKYQINGVKYPITVVELIAMEIDEPVGEIRANVEFNFSTPINTRLILAEFQFGEYILRLVMSDDDPIFTLQLDQETFDCKKLILDDENDKIIMKLMESSAVQGKLTISNVDIKPFKNNLIKTLNHTWA